MKSLFSPSRTPKKLRDLAWTALAILTAWWVGLFYEFNLHKYFTIDEYSYAHIGWSWSQGKVLYRDVFAIHHPLTLWYFGIIQWIGGFLQLAWDQILLFLRLSILPVLLLTGGFVYLINRRFGIFGVAGALIGPLTVKIFMTRASEIRPDFICASLWLGCLAILCSQRFLGQTRKKKRGPCRMATRACHLRKPKGLSLCLCHSNRLAFGPLELMEAVSPLGLEAPLDFCAIRTSSDWNSHHLDGSERKRRRVFTNGLCGCASS